MSSTSDPIEQFLDQIDRLNEANGNGAPPATVARYATELTRAGITLDQLTYAVDDLVLSLKYFPKIAEIMQVISRQTMANFDIAATRRWIEQTRRALEYELEETYMALPVETRGMKPKAPRVPRPDEYPDAVTAQVVRALTWERLRTFDFEDSYRMSEFVKAWERGFEAVEREVRSGRVPAELVHTPVTANSERMAELMAGPYVVDPSILE